MKKEIIIAPSSKQLRPSCFSRALFSYPQGMVLLLMLIAGRLYGQHGLEIETTAIGGNGINVQYADTDGLEVDYAAVNGVQVKEASTGLRVDAATTYGVHVISSQLYGIQVDNTGNDGLHVTYAGDDGVFVGAAQNYSMNIQGDKNVNGSIAGHVAQIFNRSVLSGADVLALKVGNTALPGGSSNFITFYRGNDAIMGEVQGNGSGAVCYTTGGCDYAEYLPILDHSESFLPGDLVGVHQGKISHHTEGAAQIMVITDQAAMLGNMPKEEEEHGYQPVSFIGQIPVRVQGPVQAGEWIVASGQHDGVGIAVASSDITLDRQIVGRAWESSSDPGVKRVNTAVGLDQSEALMYRIQIQQQRNDRQQDLIVGLQRQIEELKRLMVERPME